MLKQIFDGNKKCSHKRKSKDFRERKRMVHFHEASPKNNKYIYNRRKKESKTYMKGTAGTFSDNYRHIFICPQYLLGGSFAIAVLVKRYA